LRISLADLAAHTSPDEVLGMDRRTFLCNHAPHITAIDMFVVPTVGFRFLYGLAIIRVERRHLVWVNVTANPTADWIARQITEAFPGIRRPSTSFGTETPRMAML
jgi:hypothetical protein